MGHFYLDKLIWVIINVWIVIIFFIISLGHLNWLDLPLFVIVVVKGISNVSLSLRLLIKIDEFRCLILNLLYILRKLIDLSWFRLNKNWFGYLLILINIFIKFTFHGYQKRLWIQIEFIFFLFEIAMLFCNFRLI